MCKYQRDKSVCFSGHRKSKLLQYENRSDSDLTIEQIANELDIKIGDAIEKGYRYFFQGGCDGFDLIAARIVLKYKKIIEEELNQQYKEIVDGVGEDDVLSHQFLENKCLREIKLISVIPFPDQAKSWKSEEKLEYKEIIENSDEVITMLTKYHVSGFHLRNHYMVDNSTLLIGYCTESSGGTAGTIKYAYQKDIEVCNLAD